MNEVQDILAICEKISDSVSTEAYNEANDELSAYIQDMCKNGLDERIIKILGEVARTIVDKATNGGKR